MVLPIPKWRQWKVSAGGFRMKAGLFLSGGDTAIAVFERLHAKAYRLEAEIQGGLFMELYRVAPCQTALW
jgi:hypothetical protein